MAYVDWTDELSVGIPSIDNQHKKLITLVNTLNDSMKNGNGKETLKKVFGELVNYTVTHFSYEEKLMMQVKYANFNTHKHEHDTLTKKAKQLKEDFEHDKIMISIEVRNFLKEWILNHIKKTDKFYTKPMLDNGIQ